MILSLQTDASPAQEASAGLTLTDSVYRYLVSTYKLVASCRNRATIQLRLQFKEIAPRLAVTHWIEETFTNTSATDGIPVSGLLLLVPGDPEWSVGEFDVCCEDMAQLSVEFDEETQAPVIQLTIFDPDGVEFAIWYVGVTGRMSDPWWELTPDEFGPFNFDINHS